MEKQLTISIAAYNVENYLEKTLSSFICNSDLMEGLEVIIVNDGSRDKTCEVAKKYIEEYPNTFVLIDKPNGGYGSTINSSLKVANGRYYKLVDGDDWVDTSELEKLIDKLQYEDSDLVITKYVKHNDLDGSEEIVNDQLKYDGVCKSTNDISLSKNFAMHQITYKTELLRNINLRITENCFYTDFEFIMKPLPYIKNVTCLDLAVYIYRLGREGQSVLLSSWFKNIDQGLRVTTNLSEYYENVKNSISSEKMKNYMRDSISDSVKNKYIYLTLMPKENEPKTKIKDFSKNLKRVSPEIYKNTIKIAPPVWKLAIGLLRVSGYLLFDPIRIVMRRHNREKLS